MRNRSGVRQLAVIRTLALVVVVAAVFCVVALWRADVRSLLLRVAAPVWTMRDAAFDSRVRELEQELAVARAQAADRDVIYTENIDLKNRLNRNGRVHTTLAGVLLRPPATPYDTLVVDAGRDNGVAVGSNVAAKGTVLIGTVTEVYATSARVRVWSAAGSTYDGLLMLADKTIPVEVQGQGGGSMRTQVPAGTGVTVGTSVVLPGIAGGYTSTVSHVEANEGESFETVYMHMPVNPWELRYVEIWNEDIAQ